MRTNIKLEVTPEQSKAIQIICFANGIKWGGAGCEVRHTYAPFLYIRDKNSISFGDNSEYFKCNNFEEVDADFFIATKGTLIDSKKFNANGFEAPDFPCEITYASEDMMSAVVVSKRKTYHCCMYNKEGHCFLIDLISKRLTKWPSKDLKPIVPPWYDKCSYPAIVYTSEKLVVVVQDRDFFSEEFLKKCVLLSDEEIDSLKQK